MESCTAFDPLPGDIVINIWTVIADYTHDVSDISFDESNGKG